jgi:hypothetical protein
MFLLYQFCLLLSLCSYNMNRWSVLLLNFLTRQFQRRLHLCFQHNQSLPLIMRGGGGVASCTALVISCQLPPRDPAPRIDVAVGPTPASPNTRSPVSATAHNNNAPSVSPSGLVPYTGGKASTTAITSTLAHMPGSSMAPAPIGVFNLL